MRFFSLPGLALQPSAIGLGTAVFGSLIPVETSFRMLDAYAAAGGNVLDTAHVYAAWLPDGAGKSEKTIGEWLKKSGMSGKMMVATKGGHHDMATNVSRVNASAIARDLEESLNRLQVEDIDLYFLHRDDPMLPVGEILDAVSPHVRSGRIKALGASNWTSARLRAAAQEAEARRITGFCCSQCNWSLAETNEALRGQWGAVQISPEFLRYHREARWPLFAYGSQAQGFFAQTWTWPELPHATEKQQRLLPTYYSATNVGRWQRANVLAERRGCRANDVALAYVTSQDFPGCALIGPTSVEQLQSSLAAADLVLKPGEIAFLEGEPQAA